MTTRIAAACALLLAAAVTGGCCSLGLKSCTVADEITVTAAANLNSCDGSSHSVALRIYSLTATDAFNRGDYDVSWTDEGKGLGDEKAGLKEITVVPGQAAQLIRLARPKATVALGVIANFCTQTPGCWYKVVKLEKGTTRLTINLEKVCLNAATR
jgi:type VI secretion system VasD/TssJ family lipoprotein